MQHEEILNKVHEALEAKELNFKAKMAETFAFVDGVYVPTGKFTPVREDKKARTASLPALPSASTTSQSKTRTPLAFWAKWRTLRTLTL